MIRIGIIGLGWWGKQIVTCLAESPRFKVVAGCDIDTKMAATFAAQHKFDLVGDYREMLKRPDLDAIAVVTPHALHEEMAVAAFAAGKQVFCEKPLALTATDAQRAIAACSTHGVTLAVGHNRRFAPNVMGLIETVRSGGLGKLLHIEGHWSNENTTRHASCAATKRQGIIIDRVGH